MRRQFVMLVTGTLLAVALAFPGTAPCMENDACLDCHGDAEMVGEALRIDSATFDHTAHGELGCSTCHSSVTESHPDDGLPPSKADCRDCHEEINSEYARSGHAGNAGCGDCHNPHAVHSSREVSGQDMNRKCSACHLPADMTAAHDAWLPQADLHLEMLPCISCHTGSQNYVINLFISTRKVHKPSGIPLRGEAFDLAAFDELTKQTEGPAVDSLIDTDGDGRVTLKELRRFNGRSAHTDLRLKGMMTPEVVTHNLQILDNRWDCTFCHASGPDAMQTSFLFLPEADGSYRRLPVERGAILDVLNGTPDFYMMGATRSASMNIIGLLILAGGLVMPVGHGMLRFLTRKNRR